MTSDQIKLECLKLALASRNANAANQLTVEDAKSAIPVAAELEKFFYTPEPSFVGSVGAGA